MFETLLIAASSTQRVDFVAAPVKPSQSPYLCSRSFVVVLSRSPDNESVTTVAAWIALDTHGPAAAYIASDSRISWLVGSARFHWDFGAKTFFTASSPDIFGYTGDVLFPALTLSQLTSAMDVGASVVQDAALDKRVATFSEIVRAAWDEYPQRMRSPWEILHWGRDGSGMSSEFVLTSIGWPGKGHLFQRREVVETRSSTMVARSGSGTTALESHERLWAASDQGETSRAMFAAVVESIESGTDATSGGSPQLVGLYRIGGGRRFGLVTRQGRFVGGIPMEAPTTSELEWRNELFERVTPGGTRLPGAQRHAPRG